MNHLCQFAANRPLLSLCLAILLALPFLLQLPRVQTVDNVDYFTVEDDPDVVFSNFIRDTFGDDEFFVIAFSSPDLFTTPVLRTIAAITSELEALPDKIAALEAEQQTLVQRMEDPNLYASQPQEAQRMAARLADIDAELKQVEAEIAALLGEVTE